MSPQPTHRNGLVLAAMLGLALMVGVLAAWIDMHTSAQRRLDLLQIEARRKSVEIMAVTLDGNLMGAITLLGRTDDGMPREARNTEFVPDPHILDNLREAAQAFGAEGAFVVGRDGIVKSSWDAGGKISSGIDVRFRPYYRTAVAGKANVYAAVSVSQGRRALYFAAPIVEPSDHSWVGAVVARTDVVRVDALLRGDFEAALLLSPQRVVFAANQPSWVGSLAAEPTAERLAAIRELKQFGNLFDRDDPRLLPFELADGLHAAGGQRRAVASAQVDWNDPAGPWTLVLTEDLASTVPISRSLSVASLAFFITLLFAGMGYRLWQGQRRQQQATEQLREFAARQKASAEFRAQLSQVAARLQRCERLSELASAFLLAAREMFGAMNGTVYSATLASPQRLQLAGSAATAEPVPRWLDLGEGLLGQCALDRRRLELEAPPRGPWMLRSGLGHALPGALLLAPLVRQDELVGVVELALRAPPDAVQDEQLDELLTLLTNSLEILRRRNGAAELQELEVNA